MRSLAQHGAGVVGHLLCQDEQRTFFPLLSLSLSLSLSLFLSLSVLVTSAAEHRGLRWIVTVGARNSIEAAQAAASVGGLVPSEHSFTCCTAPVVSFFGSASCVFFQCKTLLKTSGMPCCAFHSEYDRRRASRLHKAWKHIKTSNKRVTGQLHVPTPPVTSTLTVVNHRITPRYLRSHQWGCGAAIHGGRSRSAQPCSSRLLSTRR